MSIVCNTKHIAYTYYILYLVSIHYSFVVGIKIKFLDKNKNVITINLSTIAGLRIKYLRTIVQFYIPTIILFIIN